MCSDSLKENITQTFDILELLSGYHHHVLTLADVKCLKHVDLYTLRDFGVFILCEDKGFYYVFGFMPIVSRSTVKLQATYPQYRIYEDKTNITTTL